MFVVRGECEGACFAIYEIKLAGWHVAGSKQAKTSPDSHSHAFAPDSRNVTSQEPHWQPTTTTYDSTTLTSRALTQAHHWSQNGASYAHATKGTAVPQLRLYDTLRFQFKTREGLTCISRYTVEAYLFAFGDDRHPLPETVKVLDEIITEYVCYCLRNRIKSQTHRSQLTGIHHAVSLSRRLTQQRYTHHTVVAQR